MNTPYEALLKKETKLLDLPWLCQDADCGYLHVEGKVIGFDLNKVKNDLFVIHMAR